MKKISILAVAAIALLASCGGGKNQETKTTEEPKSFEQEQLEAFVKIQVDSLASVWSQYHKIPFLAAINEGTLVLSEEEKLVKPEYLLQPKNADDLVTLAQKYRALAMYDVDRYIAKAYDMPFEEYDAAMKKLAVDIDDSAVEDLSKNLEDKMPYGECMEKFYQEEEANGRINFFWETMTAAFVEQLYVLAKHPDNELFNCFDDNAATEFSYRVILLKQSLDQLKDYDPNLAELAKAIQPLDHLNAVTVDQFKQQVGDMRNDLATIREMLLN